MATFVGLSRVPTRRMRLMESLTVTGTSFSSYKSRMLILSSACLRVLSLSIFFSSLEYSWVSDSDSSDTDDFKFLSCLCLCCVDFVSNSVILCSLCRFFW